MVKTTLEGLVSFEEINRESKSKHHAAMLQTYSKGVPDKKILLGYKRENPFENPTLHSFNGKYVQVIGAYFMNTFIAESVQEIPKPNY